MRQHYRIKHGRLCNVACTIYSASQLGWKRANPSKNGRRASQLERRGDQAAVRSKGIGEGMEVQNYASSRSLSVNALQTVNTLEKNNKGPRR